MMKILPIIVILIILNGCAFSAANHQKAGDGQYIVRAGGNKWDTKETLLKTINKRAKRLCGNENYKFLNNTEVVDSSTYSIYGPVPIRTLSRHVMC